MASLCIINKIPRPNKIIDPIGYLTNVFVVKKYRNQQIGSNLINNINNYAKVNDLELIIVWPSDQSANFYQKLQYHPQNQPIIHKLREY
jgi:N-acetylglutamate synthase-like GNAT family acetyltransferase